MAVKELKVSKATLKNWERLDIDRRDARIKLSKRANKLYSQKNIIPKEYFIDKKNIKKINELIEIINQKNLKTEDVIYNLAINLLKAKNFLSINGEEIIVNKKYKNLEQILQEKEKRVLDKNLLEYNLANNEDDILGIIYQSLLKEGNKNQKGSYYTPKYIIEKIKDKIKNNVKYLDCSCGTGSFILNLSEKFDNPLNIYGCDIDEIACFISKINLIMKYPNKDFLPNIYNVDFLLTDIFAGQKFDLIATNLPWSSRGGVNVKDDLYNEIHSKEIFSYFIVKAESLLSKKGKCEFILPESILNVRTHSDIRKFILDKFCITQIELLGKPFASVLTDVILLELDKVQQGKYICIRGKDSKKFIEQKFYKGNENFNFSILDKKDTDLLNKIYSVPYTTLEDSIFALGIVTGNNEKYISANNQMGEKIYTGKDISPYFVRDTNQYIEYNRNNFQQVASDEIYKAKEKLVYKFISKKLVFAYDNEQKLFLNSANILIPKVRTHSIKTVLAFLNSKLFQYIYEKKFNELKILKGNLLRLPFPILENKTKETIENLADRYLITKEISYVDKIDKMIFDIFKLNENDLVPGVN